MSKGFPTMIHEDDAHAEVPDRSADLSPDQELQNANESKRKRTLSEKQLLALAKGREKRWKRSQDAGQQGREEEVNRRSNLPPLEFPSAAEARDYADINDQGYCTASSTDSDEDEEDRRRKTLYRLRESIPRSMRKRVDKYIKMKLEESKTRPPQQPSVTPYDAYLNLPPLPPSNSKAMNSKPGELSPVDEEDKENRPPLYKYDAFPYNYL